MILGIDPGFGGGLAFLSNKQLQTHYMPVRKYNGKTKMNAVALAKLLKPYAPKIKLAVIERVGAMPNQGVSSMFNFGYGAGIIEGVLAALDIKFVHIKPEVWKASLGLDRTKANSLKLAIKLFPGYAGQFALKRDDGKAEAALMAYFAERNL